MRARLVASVAKKGALCGALIFGLSACVGGEALMQETSRSLARSAVNSAATQYLPGVNVAPVTDCVINNAETGEILGLARAASAGSQGAAEAWPIVRSVISRAPAQQCLMQSLSSADLLRSGGALLR